MQKHHSQPRSDLRLRLSPLTHIQHYCSSAFCECMSPGLNHLLESKLCLSMLSEFAVQLKELFEGPYRTLEAFRADGKATVSSTFA